MLPRVRGRGFSNVVQMTGRGNPILSPEITECQQIDRIGKQSTTAWQSFGASFQSN